MYLSKEQLEELTHFDTPTVWNALEGFKLRPAIIGFSWPGLTLMTSRTKPLVGYAVTAKVSGLTAPAAAEKAMMFDFYANVRAMDAPSIAVVEDVDEIPIGSFWGEVQATTFKALGAEGTITHGGVRDLTEVNDLDFQFFATCIMVARAESHVIDTNCTVRISGMTVHPGDLIHADLHGAVVIPEEAAPALAEACRRVSNAERCVLEPCREAIRTGTKPTIDQLRQWRGEMAKRR
ncbi:MAG: RraA family protein [Spirochaetaceae bacterium]|jgi:regulator of RNase E activity RraA|nr:RraA family protein [Spirochaetaceae bacterium]